MRFYFYEFYVAVNSSIQYGIDSAPNVPVATRTVVLRACREAGEDVLGVDINGIYGSFIKFAHNVIYRAHSSDLGTVCIPGTREYISPMSLVEGS